MNNTEQKLKKLFDFQKFNKNQKLDRLIEEAEGVELTDEDLSKVNAAGNVDLSVRCSYDVNKGND